VLTLYVEIKKEKSFIVRESTLWFKNKAYF